MTQPKTTSLLEKAKLFVPVRNAKKRNVSEEHVQLAWAFAKGEVTAVQVNYALGRKNDPRTFLGQVFSYLAKEGRVKLLAK